MGCVLQVGAKRVPGRLLNESAGGFSVLVGGPLDLGVDQTAELHSDSGWFEVQVAHVMEASPPEGGDAKSSEEEPGPWFRLGLRRLREIPPDEPSISVFAEDRCVGLRPSCPLGSLFMAPGLLLVAAMIALPLGMAAMIWHAGQSVPANDSGRVGFELNPSGFSESESVFPSRGDEMPQVPAAKGKEMRREPLDRLPRNVALIPPEVARHLHLTKDQQEQILRLENATAEALHKLSPDSSLQIDEWRRIVERRAELLDQARRQVLKLLTEEQRAQWKTLFAEPPQIGQAPAQ
jgi:hypothetical protein